jgi:hypothetical protein
VFRSPQKAKKLTYDSLGPAGRLSTFKSKGEPDAHGQAALLLAESLIHMLVDIRILSLGQAVEVLQIAAEVKSRWRRPESPKPG